jgi:hypothetical protein
MTRKNRTGENGLGDLGWSVEGTVGSGRRLGCKVAGPQLSANRQVAEPGK